MADTINSNFESAWESVRSVPTVNIDFGSGITVKRTLHGNIATCVCTPEGYVVDIITGLYSPKAYAHRLQQAQEIVRRVEQAGASHRMELLTIYHRQVLTENAVAPVPEGPSNNSLSPDDMEHWQVLVKDTQQNNGLRRQRIHQMLLANEWVRPNQIIKRVYKEVLHVDLDDPYLGLSKLLYVGSPE